MDLAGIFENKSTGEYYWLDCLFEDEIKKAKYFVDCDCACQHHVCSRSDLYEDVLTMFGHVDEIQNEEELRDDELYVVAYYKTGKYDELYQFVDFGITKQEIIENVKANKYVEGASYHTMGQMFYTTKKIMEERK